MQRKTWLGALIVFVVAIGVYSAFHYSTAQRTPMIVDESKLDTSVGKRTGIIGQALDAKAGAVVKIGSRIVYINNLANWPTELAGKKIHATGMLISTKYIPDPGEDATLLATGTPGEQLVLEEATWEIVP